MLKTWTLLAFVLLVPLVACGSSPKTPPGDAAHKACRQYDAATGGSSERAKLQDTLDGVTLATDGNPLRVQLLTPELAARAIGEGWHARFTKTRTTLVSVQTPPSRERTGEADLYRVRVVAVGDLDEHALWAPRERSGEPTSAGVASELIAYQPPEPGATEPRVRDPLGGLVIDGITWGLTGGKHDPAPRRPGAESADVKAVAQGVAAAEGSAPSPNRREHFDQLLFMLDDVCPRSKNTAGSPCVGYSLLDAAEGAARGLVLEARYELPHSDGTSCGYERTFEVPLPAGDTTGARIEALFDGGPLAIRYLWGASSRGR